ncbi:MAG: hypothetical protein H3C62_16715 [Gemmatimonadaceae bacterium]|nr:hypothetical protein [Gemmatimonadaceae bacterium]
MKADDIPWSDPVRLAELIQSDPSHVTPLMLERLLEHAGFVDAGTMPTVGGTRCVVWAHRSRQTHPQLARFRVLVYQTPLVGEFRVISAMRTLQQAAGTLVSCGLAADEVILITKNMIP